ncbi:hypothetical protein BKA70DRAFT_1335581 [Coprinopsis sp. MPI-PUGE-AT-0042]|nr:hypothetical protein BKA70DRAFT_1335581 [Coprinopsis sp. MPI-PUGE-AT-0042]
MRSNAFCSSLILAFAWTRQVRYTDRKRSYPLTFGLKNASATSLPPHPLHAGRPQGHHSSRSFLFRPRSLSYPQSHHTSGYTLITAPHKH